MPISLNRCENVNELTICATLLESEPLPQFLMAYRLSRLHLFPRAGDGFDKRRIMFAGVPFQVVLIERHNRLARQLVGGTG